MIPIQRTDIRLKADPRKVVLRYLDFGGPERVEAVAPFVYGLDEAAAKAHLQAILDDFQGRHFELTAVFLEHYHRLGLTPPDGVSPVKQHLIGAYFTHEYSIEAAALFNPSIVPHPDQRHLEEGELRFILSLRACGEGHISSVAFQTGVLTASGAIRLDPTASRLTCGRKKADLSFEKSFVLQRAATEGAVPELIRNRLPERFTEGEALAVIAGLEKEHQLDLSAGREAVLKIFEDNYNLTFPKDTLLSSRVLFPVSRAEANGMEDVRFVAFEDGDDRLYLGTYTAYSGRSIRPQLIETRDFQYFHVRPFYGRAASNKGIALFPEKVKGKYAAVGRQDGRTLSIMYSDDLYFWEESAPLQQPARDWEMLQMGNCGSPVKTPHGWLLLTHAVGPMRKYVLSFTLLDLHNPGIVLASLDEPLLSPNAEEREGYVPNVLYTCGLLQHHGHLVIPYAMSDSAISFVTVETEGVLKALLSSKT